jgi:hypothetical protein
VLYELEKRRGQHAAAAVILRDSPEPALAYLVASKKMLKLVMDLKRWSQENKQQNVDATN